MHFKFTFLDLFKNFLQSSKIYSAKLYKGKLPRISQSEFGISLMAFECPKCFYMFVEKDEIFKLVKAQFQFGKRVLNS